MANKSFKTEQIGLSDFAGDPRSYLEKAGVIQNGWLLAFADDGLIWGRMEDGKLKLSCDVYSSVSPLLRYETLKHLRLFNKDAELHIWRDDECFKGCVTKDIGSGDIYISEYIISGNKMENKEDGFTLLVEGSQGFRHAVPLDVSSDDIENRLLRLVVKHYIDFDEYGQCFVCASRLADIIMKRGGNES